ncbi:hypothetical protein GGTG_02259 [Gaeumannomyces tritici R3-111a-1]|uniref:Uncharacterized protein n=1 Tax=Gaeumannomyces tritici (strain R3-111a-1) TaxID=644352 RepID=J3NLV9_GAET3|nr:hypothetical protein GGTG_02259 [Gaeumannomyces tritici R3-111a-1]EJT82285.1 hypothetical protein GGTG_02259 [Gaeumannomyces tritici R3-111a-1]
MLWPRHRHLAGTLPKGSVPGQLCQCPLPPFCRAVSPVHLTLPAFCRAVSPVLLTVMHHKAGHVLILAQGWRSHLHPLCPLVEGTYGPAVLANHDVRLARRDLGPRQGAPAPPVNAAARPQPHVRHHRAVLGVSQAVCVVAEGRVGHGTHQGKLARARFSMWDFAVELIKERQHQNCPVLWALPNPSADGSASSSSDSEPQDGGMSLIDVLKHLDY